MKEFFLNLESLPFSSVLKNLILKIRASNMSILSWPRYSLSLVTRQDKLHPETFYKLEHTVILEYFNIILPSSLSVYSLAPKTKIICKFLWGILEGRPNRARPSQPILKNCQNGTILPIDEIWIFFWAKWLHLKCYESAI